MEKHDSVNRHVRVHDLAIMSDMRDEEPMIQFQRVPYRTAKPFARNESKKLAEALRDRLQKTRGALRNYVDAMHLANVGISPRRGSNVAPRRRLRGSARLGRGSGRTHEDTNNAVTQTNVDTTLDGKFLDSFHAARVPNNRSKQSSRPVSPISIAQLGVATCFLDEMKVWDIVFGEVIRQVHVNCRDRGSLLSKIRERFMDMFQLLFKIVRAQQNVLENYHKRYAQMRPRTGTVDKKYRDAKRKQEMETAVMHVKRHVRDVRRLQIRLEDLSTGLHPPEPRSGASSPGVRQKSIEWTTPAEFESTKEHFKALLLELGEFERETINFKRFMIGQDESSRSAREAMEKHKLKVMMREQEVRQQMEAAAMLQKHWRGTFERRTVIKALRLEREKERLREERLAHEEAERRYAEECERAAKRLQRYFRRQASMGKWFSSAEKVVAKRRKSVMLKRHKDMLERLGWRNYVEAARTIQRFWRHELWKGVAWRQKVLSRMRAELETKLIDSIDDESLKEETNKIIMLQLQQQQFKFLSRFSELRAQMSSVQHANSELLAKYHSSKRLHEEKLGMRSI